MITQKQNLYACSEIAQSGVPLLCELSVCFVSFVVSLPLFLNHKVHEEKRQRKGTRRTKPCPSLRGIELIGGPKESMVTDPIFNTKKETRSFLKQITPIAQKQKLYACGGNK